jgi:Lipocalin-like domain
MIRGIPERKGQLMVDLIGTWRLESAYFVAQETGDRLDVLGAEPFGYVIFEPGGRLIVLITSSARTRAAAASDMVGLHKSMIAYTGRWSIDGEKFITQVDGAWDPSWVGTEQVRHFVLDGCTLSIRTAPLDHPSFPGQEVIGYVDWEKEV